jgi:hypothetical protein
VASQLLHFQDKEFDVSPTVPFLKQYGLTVDRFTVKMGSVCASKMSAVTLCYSPTIESKCEIIIIIIIGLVAVDSAHK